MLLTADHPGNDFHPAFYFSGQVGRELAEAVFVPSLTMAFLSVDHNLVLIPDVFSDGVLYGEVSSGDGVDVPLLEVKPRCPAQIVIEDPEDYRYQDEGAGYQ